MNHQRLDGALEPLLHAGQEVPKRAKRAWNGFLDFAVKDNVLEVAIGLMYVNLSLIIESRCPYFTYNITTTTPFPPILHSSTPTKKTNPTPNPKTNPSPQPSLSLHNPSNIIRVRNPPPTPLPPPLPKPQHGREIRRPKTRSPLPTTRRLQHAQTSS